MYALWDPKAKRFLNKNGVPRIFCTAAGAKNARRYATSYSWSPKYEICYVAPLQRLHRVHD